MKHTLRTIIPVLLPLLLAGCANAVVENIITVSANGNGDYATIQEAVNAVPDNGRESTVIFVREGTYYEKVSIPASKTNIILRGEKAETTILTYNDHAGLDNGQGGRLGTFQSQTLHIAADDFTATDITIANSFPNTMANVAAFGDVQAVAVKVTSDRVCFYDCRITGFQDTFLGEGNGRIYVKNCYVEGNVDFIFGSAVMVFDQCITYANRHNSVIMAPSTLPESQFGIVMLDCDLTAMAEGEPDFDGRPFGYFHLGRAWRNAPRGVFIRCNVPATLNPEGWTTMRDYEPLLFAEYGNYGPGASPEDLASRRNGGRQLSVEEAAEYTIENIFSTATNPVYTFNWIPPGKDEIN